MYQDKPPRRGFHPVYLFLLIPYAAWIWPPFYNRVEPQLLGIPFFYWWQVAGIFLTAISIVPVYFWQGEAGIAKGPVDLSPGPSAAASHDQVRREAGRGPESQP